MIVKNTTLALDTSVAGEWLEVELLPGGCLAIAFCRRGRSGGSSTIRSCRVARPADVEDLGKHLVGHAVTFLGDEASRPARALLTRSVDELELSVRTGNCLQIAGISTLGELLQKTDAELRGMKHSSSRCVREIDEELAKLGLRRESAGSPR